MNACSKDHNIKYFAFIEKKKKERKEEDFGKICTGQQSDDGNPLNIRIFHIVGSYTSFNKPKHTTTHILQDTKKDLYLMFWVVSSNKKKKSLVHFGR